MCPLLTILLWQAPLSPPFSLEIRSNTEAVSVEETVCIEMNVQYPSTYHWIADSSLDHLISPMNPLDPLFTLSEWESISSSVVSEAEVVSHTLRLALIPHQAGPLALSFHDVVLHADSPLLPSVAISTPIFSIQVSSTPSFLPPESIIIGAVVGGIFLSLLMIVWWKKWHVSSLSSNTRKEMLTHWHSQWQDAVACRNSEMQKKLATLFLTHIKQSLNLTSDTLTTLEIGETLAFQSDLSPQTKQVYLELWNHMELIRFSPFSPSQEELIQVHALLLRFFACQDH